MYNHVIMYNQDLKLFLATVCLCLITLIRSYSFSFQQAVDNDVYSDAGFTVTSIIRAVPADEDEEEELSSSQIAGIVIGVVVGVLLLVIIILMVYCLWYVYVCT